MSRKHRNYQNWAPGFTTDKVSEGLADQPEMNLAGGDHFATRARANDFVRLMRTLPDPDPVLKKMGKGITALQELLTDSHLESVWSVRCSAASGAEWFMAAGADGKREQEAADAFAEQLSALDVPLIIEEMMNAVAYGYSPLEVLWKQDGDRWGIGGIVGKPPQWFEFDQDNRLVFRTGAMGIEEIPENRFLLVRHRPSYANPYGDKLFSKCFWPVTFKKNGFRWWTVFVEKYGGAFLYGKYPNNAGEEYKAELLGALEKMISDAVAIAPEGADITIEALANKGSVSNVHAEYIAMANAEISKAILGQTLTTEIGDKGSYAAAKTHNRVREDLAAADRRRIAAAFNRLASVFTFYNFGADVVPPVFSFVKDEDLQTDRADRDTKLFVMGWRPKKSYIAWEYGIPEDDFDIADAMQAFAAQVGGRPGHSHGHAETTAATGVPPTRKPKTLAERFAALFASKEDKAAAKDDTLMGDYEETLLGKAQEDMDAKINALVDAAGSATTYEDALEALVSAYGRLDFTRGAELLDNARYAASQIGARRG